MGVEVSLRFWEVGACSLWSQGSRLATVKPRPASDHKCFGGKCIIEMQNCDKNSNRTISGNKNVY